MKVFIIAGPTASGKSALALEKASAENGVIINADSMQVYDGLPILTAQPSEKDKDLVPHCLYGALHPDNPCSAGNWREIVIPVIREVLEAGQTPIVTGGSGLYIKALTDGLSPIPDIPEEVRDAAAARQKELGNPAFHAELKERDPEMATRLHPYHTARLIRAREVLEATGKSLAEWQRLPPEKPPEDWQFDITLVLPDRETLYRRCNERFLWMLDNGAEAEAEDFTRKVEKGEIRRDVPLTRALGLSHICEYQTGRSSKTEAVERAQAETRHYAKRQVTWFRNQVQAREGVSIEVLKL